MKKFNYKEVQKKYEDSLSQFDFDKVFSNPDHGTLKFSEIQEEFESFFAIIFELEFLDFRKNLHPVDVNQVENARNQTSTYFNQVGQFNIEQPNASQVKINTINEIRNFINSQLKILDDILVKIKTKKFFESSKGDVAFKEAQVEKEKIIRLREETEKIKTEAEKAKNELEENIKSIQSLKMSPTEKKLGAKKVSQFFSIQADKHKKFAEGEGKDDKNSWKRDRESFLKYIYWLLLVSIVLYILTFLCAVSDFFDGYTLEMWENFWSIRVGVFIFSLLSVLYTGLYFATKNYSKEKNLEYQNENKTNIAETIGLIASGEKDNTREIIYTEAVKTIFSDINLGQQKDSGGQKVQISVSPPNASQILDDNLIKE